MKTSWFAMGALGLCVASAAGAQKQSPIDAGGWIIAGSALVDRTHDDQSDRNTANVQLLPSVLRFVTQRLAIGGSVDVGYVSSGDDHSWNYGIGPSARYYFGDPAGKTFPFLSATVSPSWQRTHSVLLSSSQPAIARDVSTNRLSIDGSAGITQLVSTNVGVTGEAYYTHHSFGIDVPGASDATGYSYGLRFGITVFARRTP